jgi:dihydroorotase
MTPTPLPLRLAGARVIDPATRTDAELDLFVDPRGVHREPPAGADGWPSLDAAGKVVAPAFVEIHAHLREPGGESSETIASGLAAARAGGYGDVLTMANTSPVNDHPDVTRSMLDAAVRSGTGVRLHPVTAATIGLAGREPAPWAEQVAAGCVAVSDDGKPVADHEVLARVLAGCEELGVRYLSHAEVPELFGGVVHDEAAARLGVRGIPSTCESEAVRTEIEVAERVGAAIHFCHVSTRASLEHVRAARERGVRVSAEVTPHHLLLSADLFDDRGPDPDLKMNPPLRRTADCRAVRDALREGLLAAVATDHAPHAPELKCRGLEAAPFGVIGMENAFPVLHEHLVRRAGWPLALLVERLTTGPAACVGLAAGRLFGGPPRLVVLDPEAAWSVRPEGFRSRSRNCPFAGWEGRGAVAATLLEGELTPA